MSIDEVEALPATSIPLQSEREFLGHPIGLYTSMVYLTPIVGGLLADRLLGKRRTVTIGALLMAAAHFLMAFRPMRSVATDR